MATLVDLIAKKRDDKALSNAEIDRLVHAFSSGDLADYQLSAWLMAVFLRGMTDDETVALTHAMRDSGIVVDLSHVAGIKVDKHSTGGVGDKVSLCLAPLVAACGVYVPMVSGRGLGHTGGTLDKLEAIAGFRTSLSIDDFRRIVAEVGTAMMGQTAELAPADKRMYALRDVTATVESLPLIVASILSKKLAEGIDALVLDVKVGRGAFMKTLDAARSLGQSLVRVGSAGGKRVVALLTDMDAPLGLTIGNALETREAIEVLHGRGPGDLVACTLALGAEMLVLGGKARTLTEAATMLDAARHDGRGAHVMRELISAQGGDARVVDEPDRLAAAPVHLVVTAPRAGFVSDVDPLALAHVALELGAGRTRAEQEVLHDVGLVIEAPRGARIAAGQALAVIHAREDASARSMIARVAQAFTIADAPPAPRSLLIERINA